MAVKWFMVLIAVAVSMPTPAHAQDRCAAGPCEAASSEDRSPWQPHYLALSFNIGISSFVDDGALSARLQSAGLEPLPSYYTSVGGSSVLAFESGLVIAPQYRFATGHSGTLAGGPEVSLKVHAPLLDVGYLAIERDELVVYPLIGIGLGATALSISQPAAPTKFDDTVRAALAGRASLLPLESYSVALHAGVVAAVWGSGHGDSIGGRAGILVAPGERSWKNIGNSVERGPTPPLTGAYLLITFGWHTPGPRRGIDITPFE